MNFEKVQQEYKMSNVTLYRIETFSTHFTFTFLELGQQLQQKLIYSNYF